MAIVSDIFTAFRSLFSMIPYSRKLAKRAIAFIDFIFPKNNQLIAMSSNAGLKALGGPRAIFESIKKKHPEYTAVYLLKNPKDEWQTELYSAEGILAFLMAKFAFVSHGIADFGFMRSSRRKIVISTWHGTPLKLIGFRSNRMLNKRELQRKKEGLGYIDYWLVSSKQEAALFSYAFGFNARDFLLVGHPRNDQLLQRNSTKKELRKYLKWISDDTRVVLYAPTFRTTENLEGPDMKKTEIFPFDDLNIDKMQKELELTNTVILLRTHPYEEDVEFWFGKRIIDFRSSVCPDIYEVLADIDIVVTDYSSIAYDFMLLDRPVVYLPYDLKEYRNEFDFIVDDYDFWTPGAKPDTMKEFLFQVTKNQDPCGVRRRRICSVLHRYQTRDTTSRILSWMKNHSRN